MKSLVWKWTGSHEPKDLVLEETKIRDLKEDEVLVRNSYIGLNPVDWKLIYQLYTEDKIGIIPGVDGAGTIESIGSNMGRIPLHARVCYHTDLNQDGSFAEYTIVKGNRMIIVPDNISDSIAAGFPCPCLTAWQAFSKIPDMKGQDVLINGSGGAVGSFLTQLCVQAGARVYVTASQKHHPDLYNMGVVATLDYKNNSWTSSLLRQLEGRKLYAIFDTVSGASAAGLADLLGYYGHLISIQDRIENNPIQAFTTSISLHEVALAAFHQYASDAQVAQLMEDGTNLLNKIGNGLIKVKSPQIEPFQNLNNVLQKMKEGKSMCKTVVKI